jgi:uncharacterized protein (TIGR02217 family)
MFLNIRLPDDISYGAVGGPEFSTNITTLNNGCEHRNINWNYPRHLYNISYDILNKSMIKSLLDFFLIAQGKAHSFRFRDWLDYETKSELITQSSINNDKKTFQINKTYKINDLTFTRKITKLVNGSVKIFNKDKKTLVENTDYTINYSSGLIILKNLVTEDLFADFEFDVPVRFDHDHCELTINKIALYSWKGIKLIEVME